MERETATGENAPVRAPKTPFAFLADSKLAVEKTTTRTKVRQSHLRNNGVEDEFTDKVLSLLEATEETIDGWVTAMLKEHVAYQWFSRIKGIGHENIAKVLGPIDITRARYVSSLWKYAGMHVVNVEITVDQQVDEVQTSVDALQRKLDEIRSGKPKKTKPVEDGEVPKELVMTADTVGRIINYATAKVETGFQPVIRGYAPKREAGQKLGHNSELRTMCFRLAGSLIKAQGAYAKYYDDKKQQLVMKYKAQGITIVPTLELPKKGGKFFEPVGTISTSHVHMQAMRKMTKLFLSHLWLVWREAEGLPTNAPYVQEHMGHQHIISPWEMCEKPARTPRKPRKVKA